MLRVYISIYLYVKEYTPTSEYSTLFVFFVVFEIISVIYWFPSTDEGSILKVKESLEFCLI